MQVHTQTKLWEKDECLWKVRYSEESKKARDMRDKLRRGERPGATAASWVRPSFSLLCCFSLHCSLRSHLSPRKLPLSFCDLTILVLMEPPSHDFVSLPDHLPQMLITSWTAPVYKLLAQVAHLRQLDDNGMDLACFMDGHPSGRYDQLWGSEVQPSRQSCLQIMCVGRDRLFESGHEFCWRAKTFLEHSWIQQDYKIHSVVTVPFSTVECTECRIHLNLTKFI